MRIAILEDDPDQTALVSLWLQDGDYSVTSQMSSSAFIRTVRRDSFDLYLLDWVVPDLSGVEVLKKLRQEMGDNTPVIMATVKDNEESVVQALQAGADDYIVKPMRRAELLARVAAILRRAGLEAEAEKAIDAHPYMLDVRQQSLLLNDESIALTNREFELAALLFRNAGKLLSRNHILDTIWGIEDGKISTRTVDTHISRLRKKLRLDSGTGWKLTAVYQHGYRIERDAPLSTQEE